MSILEYLKGNAIEPISPDISGAIRTIDPLHTKVHAGRAFSFSHEFLLTDTTPLYAELVVGSRDMHMQERLIITNASDIQFQLYLNPVVTIGASPITIPFRNANFNYLSSESSVTIQTVSSFTGGTLACNTLIYGEDGIGGRSAGSPVASTSELLFPLASHIGIKV
ncbi:MAG: hypothetical protein ACYC2U_08500, partial [Candidatus Amoebophilus sp.]